MEDSTMCISHKLQQRKQRADMLYECDGEETAGFAKIQMVYTHFNGFAVVLLYTVCSCIQVVDV